MLLSPLLVSILNILITHALLTRKKSIKYCFIAYVLNSVFVFGAAFLLTRYFSDGSITKYIFNLLGFIYLVYIYIVFNESIQKKIFTMLSVSVLSSIILFIATTVVTSVPIIDDKYILYLVFSVRIFLQILIFIFIYYKVRIFYKNTLEMVNDKTIKFMSLYPLSTYLVLINNYSNDSTSFTNFRNFYTPYDMLLFLVLVISGYLLVFAGISSASKIISLRYNYKIVENQVELQRQNYKKLNESLEQINALKHDMRHHISVIKSMLQERKYEQVLKYVEQFNQNELSKAISKMCDNFAADSIIKYFVSLASSKNIDLKADVNIPEDIGVNPLDLCVVLGNCLENAIEACDKLDIGAKRQIEFTSKLVGTYIVFMIKNDFDGNIIKRDSIIKTSKSEPKHGIGLSSIKETVNRYNGHVDIEYTDDKFEITIIMCTSSRSKEAIEDSDAS